MSACPLRGISQHLYPIYNRQAYPHPLQLMPMAEDTEDCKLDHYWDTVNIIIININISLAMRCIL